MEEKDLKLNKFCSLTEEEVIERYERTPSAPEQEMPNGILKQNSYNENAKLMEQSRKLLDFKENNPEVLQQRTISVGKLVPNIDDSDENDDKSDNDKTVDAPEGDADYQRPAKLDLVVGFLRLFNFISCSTSIFAVTLSILFSLSEPSKDLSIPVNLTTVYTIWSPINDEVFSAKQLEYREDDGFLFCLKIFSSLVILAYLLVTAIFVIIDSVATVTFRWKEYGELTHRHTDATSVLFLVSKSRWKLRLLTCLTVASAASLQTTQVHFFSRNSDLTTSVVSP